MNHFLDTDMDDLRQLARLIERGQDIPRRAAGLLRTIHDEVIAYRNKADSA